MVDYRYLGRSALKVSPLSLGTMMFGGPTPDDVAFRIIDKAREQGINFIDTADVYHDGKSEEVVGKGIKAHRDHWVLATKFVNSHKKGPNLGGHSRKWVIETVENSLPSQHRLYRHPLFPPRCLRCAAGRAGARDR